MKQSQVIAFMMVLVNLILASMLTILSFLEKVPIGFMALGIALILFSIISFWVIMDEVSDDINNAKRGR